MLAPKLLATVLLGCVGALVTVSVHAADPADGMLPRVHNILLQSNGCTAQFESALEAAGYTVVTNRSLADAIFEIDVQRLDESLGAAMRYAVSLQRPGGYELFGRSGVDNSTDEAEVCENISGDVTQALVERNSAMPANRAGSRVWP